MSKRSNWSIPYVIFLVFFVALPLVLVMVYAFQDGQGRFTLENITKFFTDRDALSTFAVSIEVALENTGLCILLGYPAAWILANKQYNKSADVDQRPDAHPRHGPALHDAGHHPGQGDPPVRYGL